MRPRRKLILVNKGNFSSHDPFCLNRAHLVARGVTTTRAAMNGLIYLIGLIVVIMAILSFFGLR